MSSSVERPMEFDVTHAVPLAGDVDIEEIVAKMPETHLMRGMFFTPLIAELGDAFREISPNLNAPPPAGKYFALTSYSMRDYCRLFDAAARQLFPDRSGREVYRLGGQRDVDVFARSLIGKAMLSIVDDPATALLRYPEVFSMVTKGPIASTSREGARLVRLELMNFFGAPEYNLGVQEGLVLHYGFVPHTRVSLTPPNRMTFLVSWQSP